MTVMEIIILAIKGVLYAILAATIVFGGAVLVEFTYPGFKRGYPSIMKRDIAKLKNMINK